MFSISPAEYREGAVIDSCVCVSLAVLQNATRALLVSKAALTSVSIGAQFQPFFAFSFVIHSVVYSSSGKHFRCASLRVCI